VCAAAGCPSVVQSDCVTWLAQVDAAVPGVVVSAKSGAGLDLIDVKVTVDGQPFLTKLDGQAVPMNAGAHAFHFEAPDGTALDRDVMVTEGQKSQVVSVVLGAPPAAGPATSTSGTSTLRTVGWVAGGVGVAGVALGAVFGIVAVSDKSSAHCTNNLCDPGTSSGIKSSALIADVGIIGGGVLLAGGVALLLFGPKGASTAAPDPAHGVRVVPVVTASGGQLVAVGSF